MPALLRTAAALIFYFLSIRIMVLSGNSRQIFEFKAVIRKILRYKGLALGSHGMRILVSCLLQSSVGKEHLPQRTQRRTEETRDGLKNAEGIRTC
jgi:hypothetical protein